MTRPIRYEVIAPTEDTPVLVAEAETAEGARLAARVNLEEGFEGTLIIQPVGMDVNCMNQELAYRDPRGDIVVRGNSITKGWV